MRSFVTMQLNENQVFKIKRLKKDGSINYDYVKMIAKSLRAGNTFLLPVDSIYGFICKFNDEKLSKLPGCYDDSGKVEVVISNFKMLENMAVVDKFKYDFLKRIWPGEVIVQLQNKNCNDELDFLLRMPRHKYLLDIIDEVNAPLLYMPATKKNKSIFKDKDLVKNFKEECSMLIIDEFGKNHTFPTLIDISCNKLEILNEGRVCSDEIKSLYFLGDI